MPNSIRNRNITPFDTSYMWKIQIASIDRRQSRKIRRHYQKCIAKFVRNGEWRDPRNFRSSRNKYGRGCEYFGGCWRRVVEFLWLWWKVFVRGRRFEFWLCGDEGFVRVFFVIRENWDVFMFCSFKLSDVSFGLFDLFNGLKAYY